MSQNIIMDPDTFSRIQKMLDKNANLNQIVTTFKKEKNLSYSHTTVKNMIQRKFYKVWDKEKRKWVEWLSESQLPKDHLPEQIGIEEMQNTMVIPTPTIKESPELPKPIKPVQTEPIAKNSKQDSETVSMILQKMYRLQKDVEDIKKILLELQRDNPKDRVIEATEAFYRIYASDKNKSSVSINTELRDMVRKMMHDNYGINDNDSLVINLALLMAVYCKR